MLVPYPLANACEPTLLEWTMAEPSDPEPHRWIGSVNILNKPFNSTQRTPLR